MNGPPRLANRFPGSTTWRFDACSVSTWSLVLILTVCQPWVQVDSSSKPFMRLFSPCTLALSENSSDKKQMHKWLQLNKWRLHSDPTSSYTSYCRVGCQVMVVPPVVIQVMDDHGLVLKQPWWRLGIPHFRKPPYQYISDGWLDWELINYKWRLNADI